MKTKIKTFIAFFSFWLFSTFFLLTLRRPSLKEISWGDRGYKEKIIPDSGFFDMLPNKMVQALLLTLVISAIYIMILNVIRFFGKKSLSN